MGKNDFKKRWIKCSVMGFLIAFGISMFIMQMQQVSLIKGNSYYVSNVTVFLKTILWPVKACIIYSIITEIICQIMFLINEFIIPKEKTSKSTIEYIIILIVSNIVSFIIAAFIIISNFNFVF